MIFQDNLKIFQYHFPFKPIFPGALMIDYIKNCILKSENFDCNSSAKFLRPICPNKEIDFKIEYKNNDILVDVYNEELTYVKFKLEKKYSQPDFTSIEEKLSKRKEIKERFKPMANSSKEITFLDDWFILDKSDGITAVGEFKYKSCYLDFLSEIDKNKNFGLDFLLIEFMSLTVLSSLASEKIISLEDNYGFARLKNYWSRYDLIDGDTLTAIVNSDIAVNGILWSGYVMKGNQIIASINQGIDLPLKEKR